MYLSDVIIGITFQFQMYSLHKEGAKALTTRSSQLHVNAVRRQSILKIFAAIQQMQVVKALQNVYARMRYWYIQ
jgi:hypothetical protein